MRSQQVFVVLFSTNLHLTHTHTEYQPLIYNRIRLLTADSVVIEGVSSFKTGVMTRLAPIAL